MGTLIIYDSTGFVISQASGDVREPIGIPFMWVNVPAGKRVASVDVSGETHVAVFEDLPQSQEQKILNLEQSVLELSMIVAGGAV